MDQSETRKTIVLTAVGIVFLVISLVVPPLIAGNDTVVSLPAGSTFGGQISQYMGIPSDQSDLAVEGKDFSIDKSKLFANNTWAFVHFKALSSRVSENGYALFRNQNGVYTLTFGPTTIFASDNLQGIPDDLVAYLYAQGAVL